MQPEYNDIRELAADNAIRAVASALDEIKKAKDIGDWQLVEQMLQYASRIANHHRYTMEVLNGCS